MIKTQAHSQNGLVGKIVFLIGNDATIMHPLAVGFAKKGCDIVLASQRMPLDIANTIRESVLSLGHRFLHLDALINIRKAEVAVAEIKREFGGIDYLVDLSGRSKKRPSSPEERQARSWLLKTIFHEIKKHKKENDNEYINN